MRQENESKKGICYQMKLSNLQMFSSYMLFAFLFVGCDFNSLSPERYARWMTTNQSRLSAHSTQADLNLSLSYLPADWLALREAGVENTGTLAKARTEYAGLEYYRLRIALQSGQGDVLQFKAGSTDEYYQRVEYFSFGLQNDIRLLAGKDTLPCRLFHFERNYGAAPYADFMLGFDEKPENRTDRILFYDDKVFSNSLIHLTIPAETIQRIPKLK